MIHLIHHRGSDDCHERSLSHLCRQVPPETPTGPLPVPTTTVVVLSKSSNLTYWSFSCRQRIIGTSVDLFILNHCGSHPYRMIRAFGTTAGNMRLSWSQLTYCACPWSSRPTFLCQVSSGWGPMPWVAAILRLRLSTGSTMWQDGFGLDRIDKRTR